MARRSTSSATPLKSSSEVASEIIQPSEVIPETQLELSEALIDAHTTTASELLQFRKKGEYLAAVD